MATDIYNVHAYYPDDNVLSTLKYIATQNVSALKDENGVNQDLDVRASSNVNVEARNKINLYTGDGKVSLFNTDYDASDDTRTDTKFLDISKGVSNDVTVSAYDGPLRLLPGDEQNTVQIGDMTLTDGTDGKLRLDLAASMSNGLRINAHVDIRDSLQVGANAYVSNNVIAMGDYFGKNYNLFKDANIHTGNASRIGYTFHINEYDQLELIKYCYFDNDVETCARVATFGINTMTQDFTESNTYIAFDALNGVSMISGSGGSIPISSGGGGSGSATISMSNNTFAFTTLSGKTYLDAHMEPKVNNLIDLGSDLKKFKDLYLNGAAYFGDIKITRNSDGTGLKITDLNNNLVSFQSASGTTFSTSNLQLLNTSFSGVTKFDGSIEPLNETINIGTSVKPFNNLYAKSISLSNGVTIETSNNAVKLDYMIASDVTVENDLVVNGSVMQNGKFVTTRVSDVANNSIAFWNSNLECYDYTSNIVIVNNKVGIGKLNPTRTLDVVGDINLTGNIYQNGALFSAPTGGGGGGNSQWVDGDGLIYYTLGNVGIGVESTAEKLEVAGNIKATQLICSQSTGISPLIISSTTLVSNLNCEFLNGHASSYYTNVDNFTSGILGVARGGTGASTSTGTGSVVLSADPTFTGTVSAATVNATTLQQGGVGVSLSGHVHSASDITSGILGVARGGTGASTSTGTGSVVLSADPTFTGTVSAATVNATTLQQGGVGVSLSGHVHSASDITSGVLGVARGGTGMSDFLSNKLIIGNSSNNLYQTSNLHWDNINSRLGINLNNSNPTYALDVGGDIRASQDVISFSDSRLKENVEVINNAVEKLKKINGYTFTRNDIEDKERRFAGVLAQEVQQVLPEVVNTNQNGYLSVAYGNIVSLIIQANKEIVNRLECLESKVRLNE